MTGAQIVAVVVVPLLFAVAVIQEARRRRRLDRLVRGEYERAATRDDVRHPLRFRR